MATPYANAVPITRLSFSGLTLLEAALIDGSKWGSGGYGRGVALTYSFPWASGEAPSYAGGYSSSNEWSLSSALDSNERAAVTDILADVALGAGITFSFVADNASTVGELRFTETSRSGYAHAYLPFGHTTRSGDVWFSRDYWNPDGTPVKPGSYEHMTIIHEVGHALGLKHSFELGESGVALPARYDHYEWTVMSYSAHEGAGDHVWARFHPTTLMYLDLVALEQMYGPSRNANPGDTEYIYRQGGTYWETISDSGGNDTIIYEASSRGGLIDLSNHDFSRMGRPVGFSDGTRTFDTIRLGPSTIIENATGGEGGDRLIGNFAANRLTGRGGADELIGNGGADVLNGGAGRDVLTGGRGNDTLLWKAGDLAYGGPGTDSLKLAGGNLDLTRGGTGLFDIELVDMMGAGSNQLKLAKSDLLDLSSSSNTLRILGDTGDMLDIVGAYTDKGVAGGYHRYSLGAGTLLVDPDVGVV